MKLLTNPQYLEGTEHLQVRLGSNHRFSYYRCFAKNCYRTKKAMILNIFFSYLIVKFEYTISYYYTKNNPLLIQVGGLFLCFFEFFSFFCFCFLWKIVFLLCGNNFLIYNQIVN